MKLSLCMIVGNVEEYIERCLSSFRDYVDEIVLVRAIGNQEPDNTLDIGSKKFGAKTGEYFNKPEHSSWNHVDDFAAARQMSYDLGSGEYRMWADSDDVLESGGEHIRQLADAGGYPVFLFPYRIFGRGVNVMRERMMIPRGKWHFPVHECYRFPFKVNGVRDDRIIITHLPKPDKSGGHERNLRILQSIPEAERTCGIWYHLATELRGTKEGVEAAKKVILDPDAGRPEKYEMLLDMARTVKSHDARMAYLHQAHLTDPNRREALGLLTTYSIDAGKYRDSLAYARQMMATPQPSEEAWNDRPDAYTWLGVEIYGQALRVNGMDDEANRIRIKSLEANNGPMISLVHATRGRCEQAARAKKLWLDLADNAGAIEHIFVIDPDDASSRPLRRMHHIETTPALKPVNGEIELGGGCVRAWNLGLMACRAPVIVQMSDDWTPPAQWDKLILDRLGDLEKASVLAISDGHRKDKLLCMAIATTKYLGEDNFLFHPWFSGVYSDNWFTMEAYRRGAVIDASDIVFTHNHPAFGNAEADETYRAQNNPERYSNGLKTLEYLQSGKDWSSIPGWFNFWPFYEDIARVLKDGDTVAEIGVWLGRSIVFLAQLCQRLGKDVRFVAVDTFRGEQDQPEHVETVQKHGGSILKAFEANLDRCGVSDRFTTVEMDSAVAANHMRDQSFAFAFIDAAHEFEFVKRDILAWIPKIKKGGILAGHDILHPPVKKAVSEIFGKKAKVSGPVWMVKL